MNKVAPTSNDSHGLAGVYFTVPPEAIRPQSAIDYDRKSEPMKTNPDYNNQLFAYQKKQELRRSLEKERGDNGESYEPEGQLV